MSHDPGQPDIDAILEDLLNGREDALAERLRVSPGLGPDVRRLRAVVSALREGDLERPSQSLLAKLSNIPARARRQAAIDRVSEGVRRVVAALVYDTWARPALAGFRGPTSSRQLAYEAPNGELCLTLSEGEGRRRVRGVFEPRTPEASSHGAVAFAAEGKTPVRAALDEDGSFAAWLEPGVFEVSLDLGDVIVDLGPIEVV